ncbi:MAG: MMPL family transporter [Planctomyces sp.]|nr:MMPL family transporter [Planctomyces sp.]
MAHDGHDASRTSWIAEAIEKLTRAACWRPGLTVWLVFISAAVCGLFAWKTLGVKTSRNDLIDPRAVYQQRWNRYADAFDDVTEDLVVVVEGRNRAAIIRAIDDLGPRLERESEYFRNVLYRIDLSRLAEKGLQFLSDDELRQLSIRLRRARVLSTMMPGAAQLRQRELAESQEAAISGLADQVEQLLGAWRNWSRLPADQQSQLTEQTRMLVHQLAQPGAEESSPTAASADRAATIEELKVRYLFNDDESMGFIQAQPVVEPGQLQGATRSVERMRRLVSAIQKRHPDTRLGLTGVPVLEHDEMKQSQAEMAEASVLSFVGVSVVLFAGFRRLRHPLLGMLMLLVGTAWSFAAASVAVGHLNILSIAFAAMLFGLGNDFAIVYLSHYASQRERGMGLYEAVIDASRSVGPGITTAAFTAAAAFFAAVLTDFAGIAELGLIAGWGILLCNLLTFIFIPPALVVWDQSWRPPPPQTPESRFAAPRLAFGGVTLAAFVVLLAVIGQHAVDVRYDTNLLNMQAEGTESLKVQQRIEEHAEGSLLYAVSLADSPEEALELKRRFEELPTVQRVEDLASMLPPPPSPRRTEVISFISNSLAALSQMQSETPDPSRIGESLDQLLAELEASTGIGLDDTALALDDFLDRLSAAPLARQIQMLTPSASAIPPEFATLANGKADEPVTLDDFPEAFTSRFVSRDNQWLLKVYPKEAVWDGQPLKQFVEDLRTVDPEVTGTPLQNYEASNSIWNSYLEAGGYALIAVIILLWWDFRTLHEVLLALSPAACGLLATLGVLGWFDLPLNPANMIMLPLLLGLGVDGGVHVLHDYRAQTGRYRISGSTARGIILAAATSIVGFGSLMVASHRGLFSLGFVLAVGVTAALATSLLALPSLLGILSAAESQAVTSPALRVVSDEEDDAERPAA